MTVEFAEASPDQPATVEVDNDTSPDAFLAALQQAKSENSQNVEMAGDDESDQPEDQDAQADADDADAIEEPKEKPKAKAQDDDAKVNPAVQARFREYAEQKRQANAERDTAKLGEQRAIAVAQTLQAELQKLRAEIGDPDEREELANFRLKQEIAKRLAAVEEEHAQQLEAVRIEVQREANLEEVHSQIDAFVSQYGEDVVSREEILLAGRKLANRVKTGLMHPDDVPDVSTIAKNLYDARVKALAKTNSVQGRRTSPRTVSTRNGAAQSRSPQGTSHDDYAALWREVSQSR